MTRTIVASATKEIIIGFDQPFCVIGERIKRRVARSLPPK